VSVDPSKLISEPLLPFPKPEETLAGQLRKEGRSDAEILHAYEVLYGMNAEEARQFLSWEGGTPTSDIENV
jgi:hypothetical protein